MAAEAVGTNIFDVAIAIITAFGGLISFFIASWLRQKAGVIKTEKQEAAVREAIQAAIDRTQKTYVEALKAAREDGKLTDEEKREAMKRSLAAAGSILAERGVKMGSEILATKIESRLASIKTESRREIAAAIIEAVAKAVSATDQTYVDDLKKDRKDGKLTEAEKSAALEMSIKAASEILVREGIAAGRSILRTYIEAHLREKRASEQRRRGENLKLKARRLYQRYAPRIKSILGADNVPEIQVELSDEGIAATAGTTLILNKSYFDEHEDDGAIIHEFTHIIHRAPTFDNTTYWLIEGIADYVRHALGFDSSTAYPHYERGKALAGYQTSAHFLLWLESVNLGGVLKLSKHLMKDTYHPKVFTQIYGKALTELVSEYEIVQQRGPA